MNNPITRGNGRGAQWLKEHLGHEGEGCLTWPMSRDDKGYGIVGYNGQSFKASRLMCIFAHGEAPSPRHHAAHSCGCGHLGCVHPGHLSWKTPAENGADTVLHGRQARKRGEARFKLTPDLVDQIRALKGFMTQVELGLAFKVSSKHIGKILNRVTWTSGYRPLTGEQIAEIRRRAGTESDRAIARSMDIKTGVVWRIRNGRSYKSVA